MAASNEPVSMALFCDFENVALGVRDANYDKFDIKPILERLLLKGSIVVKKAYCDWERYKSFKATMHEANFELIEIPHVRQSGKNSADIRLVVDALDLCYTKSHVNTFVIISGDSDFSPLVSKLRENAKQVIGIGVKQSTSDLLVANCDEFIFYDDLVRESRRTAAKRDAPAAVKRSPAEENNRREKSEARKSEAIEMAVETFDALVSERGDSGKIWASMLKEAIKRRKPDFSESYYGFRTFGNLLEEAQARGLLEFGRDEKSGAYVYRSSAVTTAQESEPSVDVAAVVEAPENVQREPRRNGRGGRKQELRQEPAPVQSTPVPSSMSVADAAIEQYEEADVLEADVVLPEVRSGRHDSRRNGRGGRKPAAVAPVASSEAWIAAEALFAQAAAPASESVAPVSASVSAQGEQQDSRRKSRGGRKSAGFKRDENVAQHAVPVTAVEPSVEPVVMAPDGAPAPAARKARGGRKPAASVLAEAQPVSASPVSAAEEVAPKTARKPARRPRKASAPSEDA